MDRDTWSAIPGFLAGIPRRNGPLPIVWHAGEPMVVGPSFYQPIFENFAAGELPISHNFQTNATLIDDEWCEFIRRWNVHIGVSIDGPASVHDRYRLDRKGRGTFDRTMLGVEALKRHGIPFSVIGVLTRDALACPDEIWDFFASLGSSLLAFNFEEQEGANVRSSLEHDDAASLVHSFFERFAQLQREHPKVRVRELDDMRRHLTAPSGSVVQSSNNRPGAIINIDVRGNVSTFSPELLGTPHADYSDFGWTNVKTGTWRSIAENPAYQRAWSDIRAGVERCRAECEYFAVCGGGNPSNKLAERGALTVSETNHCQLYVKTLADVVMNILESELRLPTRSNTEVSSS